MTTHILIGIRAESLRTRPGVSPKIGWTAWLRTVARRRRERVALAELNDFMLRDIGITRCDALREANKPCWRS